MKYHSVNDWVSLLFVSLMLTGACWSQAQPGQSLDVSQGTMIVESRPVAEPAAIEDDTQDSKGQPAESMFYHCREQPLELLSETFANFGKFFFPGELKRFDSAEGELFARLESEPLNRQIDVHAEDDDLIVRLMAPDTGTWRCHAVESCDINQLEDEIQAGRSACLDIMGNVKGRQYHWRTPHKVRLVPPGKKQPSAPFATSGGGLFLNMPPGGPEGGSPGMPELVALMTAQEEMLQEMRQELEHWQQGMAMTLPQAADGWLSPLGKTWFNSGRHQGYYCVESNPDEPGCLLLSQVAAAFALLGMLTCADKDDTASSERPADEEEEGSDSDQESDQENGQQGEQQDAGEGTDEGTEGNPPPQEQAAAAAEGGEVTVAQVLEAAHSFVVGQLQAATAIGDDLAMLYSANIGAQQVVQAAGGNTQDLSATGLAASLQGAEGSAASEQQQYAAVWMLHHVAVQSGHIDAWGWLFEQIGLTGSVHLGPTIEASFVEQLQQWFTSQIDTHEISVTEVISQQTQFTNIPGFLGSLSFADGPELINQILDAAGVISPQGTGFDLDGILDEAGVVEVPVEMPPLPEAIEPVQMTVEQQVALVSDSLVALLDQLLGNAPIAADVITLINHIAGSDLVNSAYPTPSSQILAGLQPEQIIQLVQQLLMSGGLQSQIVPSCQTGECQQLIDNLLRQPLPSDLPLVVSLTEGNRVGRISASVPSELITALNELISTQPIIRQVLASGLVLRWLQYHHLLDEAQVVAIHQNPAESVTVITQGYNSVQMVSRWLHMMSRLARLQGMRGLSVLLDNLLSHRDINRNNELARRLEVIRYWPASPPVAENLQEHCRRQDLAHFSVLSNPAVIEALVNQGELSSTTQTACQQQPDNCLPTILGDLQDSDQSHVVEILHSLLEQVSELQALLADWAHFLPERIVQLVQRGPHPELRPAPRPVSGSAEEALQARKRELQNQLGTLYGSSALTDTEYNDLSTKLAQGKVQEVVDAIRERTGTSGEQQSQVEATAPAAEASAVDKSLNQEELVEKADQHYPTLTPRQKDKGLRKARLTKMLKKLSNPAAVGRMVELVRATSWFSGKEAPELKDRSGRERALYILNSLESKENGFMLLIGLLLRLVEEQLLDQSVVDELVEEAGN